VPTGGAGDRDKTRVDSRRGPRGRCSQHAPLEVFCLGASTAPACGLSTVAEAVRVTGAADVRCSRLHRRFKLGKVVYPSVATVGASNPNRYDHSMAVVRLVFPTFLCALLGGLLSTTALASGPALRTPPTKTPAPVSGPALHSTVLAFINPARPGTRRAGGTVQFAFKVDNHTGSTQRYRYTATTQTPGRAPVRAAAGTVTLATYHFAIVRLHVRVACAATRSRISVSLGGAHPPIGFWVSCPARRALPTKGIVKPSAPGHPPTTPARPNGASASGHSPSDSTDTTLILALSSVFALGLVVGAMAVTRSGRRIHARNSARNADVSVTKGDHEPRSPGWPSVSAAMSMGELSRALEGDAYGASPSINRPRNELPGYVPELRASPWSHLRSHRAVGVGLALTLVASIVATAMTPWGRRQISLSFTYAPSPRVELSFASADPVSQQLVKGGTELVVRFAIQTSDSPTRRYPYRLTVASNRTPPLVRQGVVVTSAHGVTYASRSVVIPTRSHWTSVEIRLLGRAEYVRWFSPTGLR